VQILFGAEELQFEVGNSPQTVSNRRHAGSELARVADDDAVARQLLSVVFEKRLQMLAADLFLAFDQ
jgi:hypothetical protein